MMDRSKILVALVLLVLIQSMFVESWLWRRRRRRNNCGYPRSSKYGSTSGYYYGSTKLSFWGKKDKRSKIVSNTWALRHSLLQFRGTIFEWGIGSSKTYNMNRSLSSCKITWSYHKKGDSKCYLSDAQRWTRAYRNSYGKYRLFSNNCHHFVNRLGSYLATNCGR